MMPKDVLYIGLFSIGEIFQIFGIERLAYRKISFHLHPTLCERNDGEFRHTQFYFRNRACVGGENHVTGTKGMIPKRMPVSFAPPHSEAYFYILTRHISVGYTHYGNGVRQLQCPALHSSEIPFQNVVDEKNSSVEIAVIGV